MTAETPRRSTHTFETLESSTYGFPPKSSQKPKRLTRSKLSVDRALSRVESSFRRHTARPGGLSWDELLSLRKRQRAILLKIEQPAHRILVSWDGTVSSVLIWSPIFYMVMGIYVGVRIKAHVSGLPSLLQDLSSTDIGIIAGFLSFLLVFFAVQMYNRFFEQYRASMDCVNAIIDMAHLCKNLLTKAQGLRIIRYMNAAHIAGYVGLTDTYTFENLFLHVNYKQNLLTTDELNRMREIGMDNGSCCLNELLAWVNEDCTKPHRVEKKLDSREAMLLRRQSLFLRKSFKTMYEYQDQQVPFFYVHFLVLLSVLYLPLFALTTAWQAGTGDDLYWPKDVINGLLVLLQTVFVLGLRLLGQEMADPYGQDLDDLCIIEYLDHAWVTSNRILNADERPEVDEAVEENLASNRAPIGSAWGEEASSPFRRRKSVERYDENFYGSLRRRTSVDRFADDDDVSLDSHGA